MAGFSPTHTRVPHPTRFAASKHNGRCCFQLRCEGHCSPEVGNLQAFESTATMAQPHSVPLQQGRAGCSIASSGATLIQMDCALNSGTDAAPTPCLQGQPQDREARGFFPWQNGCQQGIATMASRCSVGLLVSRVLRLSDTCTRFVLQVGVNSVENDTVRNNLQGRSRYMSKKDWTDASGRKGKVNDRPEGMLDSLHTHASMVQGHRTQ